MRRRRLKRLADTTVSIARLLSATGGPRRRRSASAMVDSASAIELDRCLALARRSPDRFERASAAWLARWCAQIPELSLAEVCHAMKALQRLEGAESATNGARTLKELAHRHRCVAVETVLERWLAQQQP
jgi:hypothetical protein